MMKTELERISHLYNLTKFIKIIFSPIKKSDEYKRIFLENYEQLQSSEFFGKYKIYSERIYQFLENSKELELLIEYSKLFIGPYHLLAPPYGSYYLENGRLMGDSTVEVERFYDKAGLVISDEFKDLPDHILAELEFLEYLLYKQYDALINQNGQLNEYQNLFMNFTLVYFTSWVNDFVIKLLNATENNFYLTASIVLQEYAKDIKEFSNFIQN